MQTDKDELMDDVEQFTKEHLLLSGSGFDFDWDVNVEQDKKTGRGVVHCSSYYEGIDEGSYCDPIPVEVVIPMDDPDKYKVQPGKEFEAHRKEFEAMLEVQYPNDDEVSLFEYFDDAVCNAVYQFDRENERYDFLTQHAKALGFETPHTDMQKLQFDFDKFQAKDYNDLKLVLEGIQSYEDFQKASSTFNSPVISANGLNYKGELAFNENLQRAGIRFVFQGKEHSTLSGSVLPMKFGKALDGIPLEKYQAELRQQISDDIEKAILKGNITKDILQSHAPKDAMKCIAAAEKAAKTATVAR